jgi:quercetin dioxygenase-like cupin family protein
VPAPRLFRLDAIAPFALAEGVRARALFGEAAMLNLVELDPGAVVPEHSHPHEQLGIGLRGLITMVFDGEERPMGPMDAMHIPSGVVHAGVAGPEGALVLDVFTPIREDFRALAQAAAQAGAAAEIPPR